MVEISPIYVPRFDASLVDSLPSSKDAFTASTNLHIDHFNRLAGFLPTRYGWRFRTAEAFQAEMRDLAANHSLRPIDANRYYWSDTLKSCEAYSIMCTWRMVELARTVVWAISRSECICAALMSRAALETSAQYVDAARTITATIEGISSQDLEKDVAVSSELEGYLLKTVYASRLSIAEEIYKPTNIVSIVQRLAKIPGQSGLVERYERLCEVAHPNLLGRSVYVLNVIPGKIIGDETRELGLGQGPTSLQILDASVWSLSWALGTHVSAFELMQKTIARLSQALGQTPESN